MPCQLDVFATDIVNAVSRAGGWLYDQAARGWHMTVITADTADTRPLRILGVNVLDLESARAGARHPRGELISAARRLLKSNPTLRPLVLSGPSHNHNEIAEWGRRQPKVHKTTNWLQYRLSSAASAFKHQALIAAAVDQMASDINEEFWCSVAPSPVHPKR